MVGANLAALIAVGVVAWRVTARAHLLRAGLDRAEGPFLAQGLKEVASNELSASSHVDADGPATACFVAVAANGGPVRAVEGATRVGGSGSVGWCSCAAGKITVEGGDGGLALLQIDARQVGGPLARPWTGVKPSVWGETPPDCTETLVDAWIADHHGRGAGPDPKWLDAAPSRAVLKASGFHVASAIDPSKPFAAIDPSAGDCVAVVSPAQEELSVREAGGTRRIAHARGALAWCTSSAESVSVWREGSSPAVVLSVPSARIGGLLGTEETLALADVHVAPGATWLRDADLGWEATVVLRASALAGVKTADLPAEPGPASIEVTALARSGGTQVATEPAGAVVACDPALDVTDERSIVCASAAPVSWWRRGDAPGATARAPLPFWLSMLEPHHEPDAIARVPELLSLARLLVRQGFEPTVLEGVTELPEGVRVVGRAGEDAIVAVGLLPKAPWVVPYSDAVAWDLGDLPRIVDLQPGVAVKLVATPPPNTPPEKRRTVVFRRSAKHS